jgi:hypothetical protein
MVKNLKWYHQLFVRNPWHHGFLDHFDSVFCEDYIPFLCHKVLKLVDIPFLIFDFFFQIISLWHSELSLACDILRNCYEAFALYSFGRYLVACLGNLTYIPTR